MRVSDYGAANRGTRFSRPPSPRCYGELDELPSEGTSEASLQSASMSSDQRAARLGSNRG